MKNMILVQDAVAHCLKIDRGSFLVFNSPGRKFAKPHLKWALEVSTQLMRSKEKFEASYDMINLRLRVIRKM